MQEKFESNIVFEIRREDSKLLVKLSGEADLYGSSKLKRALAPHLENVSQIVFDASDLSFADSYFLRLLIKLRRRLGGVSSVKVVNVQPRVKRNFEITGLDKLFF
jgi:anti-anti-sigma factor